MESAADNQLGTCPTADEWEAVAKPIGESPEKVKLFLKT